MADRRLELRLVDEASFERIPDPFRAGARCRTCDYWERLDGSRDAPPPDAHDAGARADLKRARLLAGRALAGSYAMLAFRPPGEADATTVGLAAGFAQFGPISHYPRAQSIRDRYPELPDSPAPWVITCLQAPGAANPEERDRIGGTLLAGVRAELERRGIAVVEAYPEGITDPWQPSSGPAALYEADGWTRAAGDERFPVYRRELAGGADIGWDDMLARARPTEDDWPPVTRPGGDADDFFRLPADRPKRPNPFGDD